MARKPQVPVTVSLGSYRLEDQVGFALRKANQRHGAIFANQMTGGLTPTQWAALVKVAQHGSASQNQLGRDTAMDGATIKGVIDRLVKRALVALADDPGDGRRSLISLTAAGAELVAQALPIAAAITAETVADLGEAEHRRLMELLRKLT